jgi:UDPglucose 6-dehydrogenase
VQKLNESGAVLKLYDPQAEENFSQIMPENSKLKYYKHRYDALEDSDLLLIITDWDEFKNSDYDKVKELMASPVIIDGRNILDKDLMEEKEFKYISMGR